MQVIEGNSTQNLYSGFNNLFRLPAENIVESTLSPPLNNGV